MKSRRIPLESEVDKYEVGKGMEDGFELFSDVVTKGWIVTDSLVKIERPDGTIVCPYIKHRRGRTFIGEGDYIIVQQDGTKNVCGADKVWTRYEKPEAQIQKEVAICLPARYNIPVAFQGKQLFL